ncbi:hypothetical protein BB560_001417 [Smittium megazygosporum]|uniref:Deacetylase sirtuin-type domain-containing protein n=1 Tax=Smittium megazygosporum TaxID=133381 RepID=A0A2T9ZHK5_9FUNG|nr:hypothetical protein BB560_001417 [Smittium megazygosporum]
MESKDKKLLEFTEEKQVDSLAKLLESKLEISSSASPPKSKGQKTKKKDKDEIPEAERELKEKSEEDSKPSNEKPRKKSTGLEKTESSTEKSKSETVKEGDVKTQKQSKAVVLDLKSSEDASTESNNKTAASIPEKSSIPKSILHLKKLKADFSGIDKIAEMIKYGKAGISTSSGIPDFRSPNTGLYDNLQQYNLPYPEAIFDIEFFKENPKPFYTLAKELYPGNFSPTLSHVFIKMIADNGYLLRNYTQNIDTLERVVGIDNKYIVEAHGSFYRGHCVDGRCSTRYSQSWIKQRVDRDEIPKCTNCSALVKPDITFFGESLPTAYFRNISDDFSRCDLLMIMGTSLQVYPFASLVNKVKPNVPRLLINREVVGSVISNQKGLDFTNGTDHMFLGDSDDACYELIHKLGWEKQLLESHEAIARNFVSKWSNL